MLVRHLIASFVGDAMASSPVAACTRALRSLQALRRPARARRVLQVIGERRAELQLGRHEQLFFIQNRHYLSRRLSPGQRMSAAMHHYLYELQHYEPSFRRAVYGPGLTLWEEHAAGANFSIRLVMGHDNRLEGALSIVLYVGEQRLSVMSFSYVDAAIFGLPPVPIVFVTRIQSGREEKEHAQFKAAFHQTTPRHFCLAALGGVAVANGMRHVAAIRHDAHPAYERDNAASMANAYDEFWRAFQATELDTQAFLLPVPMATVPLSQVKAKHRRRAVERRSAWTRVTRSALAAIVQHQRSTVLQRAQQLGSAWVLIWPLLGG